ncbi:carboxypeptidase [Arthrobacter sp. PAMC 25486]|uniref:M15 family metallopeptidase n=1 Tax=Arthrobacter sp. PAMC 25486 TaxID=1494608 RepID=UPI0005360B1C|nr:M15 family metallopeptidase [Arthrobacter sp. PAMC 25486]AIY01682.1 carboxypeptidase [Arthrobacter sp. PAMC 25486]
MPVVGFHQARRPRQTRAERLRRDLSWPRPGGILVSLAGAALVFSGALALGPSGEQPSPAAASSLPSTTPNTSTASVPPAVSPPAGTFETPTSPATTPTARATLAPSGSSPSAIPAPLLVAGAIPDSPIEKLFAAGGGTPTDPALLDINNPASPLVLVNKHRPLVPVDYAPADLVPPAVPSGSAEPVLVRAEAASALESMFAAATTEGVSINVKSSYRSYETQVSVYYGYVAEKGVAAADTTSARPGFSEHQTGLAVDIGDATAGTLCDFNSCFADTAAAQWVALHGADYGFVVRYVPGEEAVTGYLAEPWHLRFVGEAAAQDMAVRGIHSYEEYLGLPGAPGYK